MRSAALFRSDDEPHPPQPLVGSSQSPARGVVAGLFYVEATGRGKKRVKRAIKSVGQFVERHVRDGERHLLRQREIVDELERHGRGNSQAAKIAREISDTFEEAQSAHLNDRAHLQLALANTT